MPKAKGVKQIASNRKAFHDYFVLERFEAGIELFGTEVKSVRLGQLNLKDSYCFIKDGELFARFMTDTGRSWDWKLFPLGVNEFGVKRWYSVVFKFEDGRISYGGYTCKKQ